MMNRLWRSPAAAGVLFRIHSFAGQSWQCYNVLVTVSISSVVGCVSILFQPLRGGRRVK